MTLRSGFARSGKADIYYEDIGEGRAVVFCHAGVSDRRLWDPQFEAVLPDHRYVRSDMRGFGKSEWVPEPYSPHRDILAVIDHLGLDDVILVGCSMGGRAVMELAVTIPERVAGILVAGSGLPGWEPEDGGYTPPQWSNLDPLWEAEDWDAIARIDAEVWAIGVSREESEVDPGFIAKMVEMDREPIKTENERDKYMTWMEPPIAGRIDEIQAPAVVVVGEHDLPDLVTSTAHLAERLGAERHVLPGTAHLPSLETPEQFNLVLGSFLRSF
jgi:pimeloyl-ACP methyl ester carboxylesterase